ncbi:MAG TPA: pyruvate ferredoxin oxidoreductase [Dehalococcoidia bacterium]|nr:pyruvate ferredoxin oxidoreductase [Dehalococcoidia bacterium]
MALGIAARAPKFVQGKAVALSGGHLAAHAMRQMNPDLVAAYPITPQTVLMELFCQFVADGRVDTELLTVESEHAAMSACIGAAAAGARVQTASAGAGIAFMWEMLWCASGMRLPIVMHVVNRSLSAPLNILGDHTDAMGCRDTGWIQLYAENGQEAYDNAIQSVRIAEHSEVLLPIMQCQDGFTISHAVQRAELLPDDAVQAFVGAYEPAHSLLDVEHPVTFGSNDDRNDFFSHKRQQWAALERALEVIPQIGQEFGRMTGRSYGYFEGHYLEDAEIVLVLMGSVAGATRMVVEEMRAEGIKVGLLKVRCYRPFPAQALAEALSSAKVIGVVDRSTCFGGQGGPLFLDTCTALFHRGLSPAVVNYICGLGGRDVVPQQIKAVFQELLEVRQGKPVEKLMRFVDGPPPYDKS